MKKRVSFHELAELELNDAKVFFENEREWLGLRFLLAVEAAVAQIQQHPHASPIIIEDIRRKVLRHLLTASCSLLNRIEFVFSRWPTKSVGRSIGKAANKRLN